MKSHRIKSAITSFIVLMGIATAAYAQSAAEITPCTTIAITPTTKATKYTQVKNIKGRLNLFQTAFDIYVFFQIVNA